MFLASLITLFLTTTLATSLSLVYQYPNTSYVNIENIALRSSTGSLLLNLATGATLVELSPYNPFPSPLITLTGPGSLTGIAETYPDVFTVAAGNFSFGPQVPGGVAGVPGSFSVWNIDLSGPSAVAKLVVAIPEANTLNGLVSLPGTPYILVVDSGLGAIWRVNIKTGAYKPIISSPLFQPTPELSLGINGLKLGKDCLLYWTNSALGTFGSVPINRKGYATSSPSVIASAPTGSSFDDFALDKNRNAYIATQPDSVSLVTSGGTVSTLAGGPASSPPIVSPTSAAFGVDGCTLYVVTGGSGRPNMLVSGQVFSIDLCYKPRRA